MGPSLVLSSVGSMAAEWNRTSRNSTFNNSGSSNDDEDDDDERPTQQRRLFSIENQTVRETESRPPEQGPRSAPSFAVASFHSHSEVDSDLRREQAATYPFNTEALVQYDNGVSVDNAASTHREPSFSSLDFSMSPLYSSVNVGHYLPPLDGVAQSSAGIMEGKRDEEDDRKPAAVASPQKDASRESTYREAAHDELISPHRKSHSISSDPFHSASTSKNQQHVPSTSQERFIDPSFSFEEEYDARGFDDAQAIIPNVWDVSERNDPKLNLHRRRHFTPPHANFAAPHRSSYAVPAPQAISFRLGDGDPDIDENPSTLDIRNIVDSIASQRETRKTISNRSSLPITVHQSTRAPARHVVLRRREASATEIESAETDRARSAIHVWYRRFNELIDYCETYGDCNVPQKHTPNPQLGIWVNKQRMEKKFLDENRRTSMTASKVEALESIGFTWAKRKGDASWLYKYHELQKFYEQFGSCDVPTKYAPNPALGRWVSTQRSEYKIFMHADGRSRHLTQEKVDMLNAIGFKWEMIPSRLSNSSSHSNGTSSGSSHNTHTSSHGAFIPSREV